MVLATRDFKWEGMSQQRKHCTDGFGSQDAAKVTNGIFEVL
jgi:hypothetical protein